MSAPEFQGEPMTRREVLLARQAVQRGLVQCTLLLTDSMRAIAASLYPFPIVTRPRVVAVEDQRGVELSVRNGVLMCRYDGCTMWRSINGLSLSQGLLAALRSLDAEPTETVTEEGEG